MSTPAVRPVSDPANLGDWLSGGVSHLAAHANAYVMGALVGGVGVFAALILGACCLGAGALFGGIASGASGAEAFVVLGALAGGVVGLLALVVCMAPISLGMHRGVLAVHQGEPFDTRQFTQAIADIPAMVIIGVVTGTLTLFGAMLCVVPGWILGGLFLFAVPHYAHSGGGAIEAIQKSVELAKPRLFAVVLYAILLNLAVSAVASVPLIGVFLILPVHSVLAIAAYLSVIGEPPLRGK